MSTLNEKVEDSNKTHDIHSVSLSSIEQNKKEEDNNSSSGHRCKFRPSFLLEFVKASEIGMIIEETV